MDQAKEKVVCPYRDKLNKTAKVWYLEKMKGVKGLDPYKHREWTADVNLLPNFSQANLYKYMLLGVSAYSHEVFTNIRPVEQGHIQFTDGWVHDLKILKVEAKTIVHMKIRRALLQLLFPGKSFHWLRHIAIAVCLLFVVNLLVILVPNIRDIFGITGATTAPSLIFILPGLFYIRIIPTDQEPIKSRPKIQAACFSALGFIFMAMSLTFIGLDWMSGEKRNLGGH